MLSFLHFLFISFAAAGPIKELPPICEGSLTVARERPPTWVDDVSCEDSFAAITLAFDNNSRCDTAVLNLTYEVEVVDVETNAFISSAFLTARRGWSSDDETLADDDTFTFTDDPLFVIPPTSEAEIALILELDEEVCLRMGGEASVMVTLNIDEMVAERAGRPVDDITPDGVIYDDYVVVRRPFRPDE